MRQLCPAQRRYLDKDSWSSKKIRIMHLQDMQYLQQASATYGTRAKRGTRIDYQLHAE
jgi:hypothetical protein